MSEQVIPNIHSISFHSLQVVSGKPYICVLLTPPPCPPFKPFAYNAVCKEVGDWLLKANGFHMIIMSIFSTDLPPPP